MYSTSKVLCVVSVSLIVLEASSLKHAETVDKSAPQIDSGVSIKKVDREGFLKAVEAGADLKHAETVDKSAPQIGDDIHVKKVDRSGFLNEVAKGVELKKQ